MTPTVVQNDNQTAPRRSERTRQEPVRYGLYISEGDDVMIMDSDDPVTFQEAMGQTDFEKWLRAMEEEMQSMSENKVWKLVEPTQGVKTIGCK